MQILVSSDDRICCDEELIRRIQGVMEGTLERFRHHVTRVEVHLSDRNSLKPGDRDKGCRLEARIASLAPVVASHEAATLTEAIHAAAGKLARTLAREIREFGKAHDRLSLNGEAAGLFGTSGAGEGATDLVR